MSILEQWRTLNNYGYYRGKTLHAMTHAVNHLLSTIV